MNRRDIMKGMAAAPVVAAAMAEQRATARPDGWPTPPMRDLLDKAVDADGPMNLLDPLSKAKRLFRYHAEEVRQVEEAKLHRQIEALNDMKSVSNAYKRYRRKELTKQQDVIFARYLKLVQNI